MNTQNYASLEACKRLVDAGIVLKTDFYWYLPHKPTMCGKTTWFIERKYYLLVYTEMFPAPSMAEVWRELPETYEAETRHLELQVDKIKRVDGVTVTSANYIYNDAESGCCVYKFFAKENPTDALIDLLIWVKKEKL